MQIIFVHFKNLKHLPCLIILLWHNGSGVIELTQENDRTQENSDAIPEQVLGPVEELSKWTQLVSV